MRNERYSVFWTNTAQNDLNSIVDYIAIHDSTTVAADIFERISKKSESLESFPLRGRVVPELSFNNIEGYREILESPWRIVYKVSDDRVYVVSVFDGRRSFESILLDRFLNT